MLEHSSRIVRINNQRDIAILVEAMTTQIHSNFDIYGKMLVYDYQDMVDENCISSANLLKFEAVL